MEPSVTMKLTKPICLGGMEVTELHFRKMNYRDRLAIVASGRQPGPKGYVRAVSRLAGIPEAAVKKLAVADFMTALRLIVEENPLKNG
jgi:hypothetical protein